MNLYLIVSIVILAYLPACGRSEQYRFERIDEICLQCPNPELICSIYDLEIDHEGNFYIADKTCHKIWVFNSEGYLLSQIGAQGQGPGELGAPVSICIRGDTLAVLEAGNSRISFFNRTGEFIAAIPITGGQLTGLEIGPNDILIVSESLGIRDFDFYTTSGKRTTSNAPKQSTGIFMPIELPGGQVSLAEDRNVLYTNIKTYNVIKLNWQGDTLTTYSAAPPGYKPPDLSSRERFMKQKSWALLGVPLQSNNKILIQWFKRQTQRHEAAEITWERFIDVFTPEGRPFASAIPAPHHFLLSRDGLLYAVETTPMLADSNNPCIIVYSFLSMQRHSD